MPAPSRWPIRSGSSRRVAHLVQNAIDASRPGETVRVCYGRARQEVAIEVIDSGSGMSRRIHPHPPVPAVRIDQGQRLRNRRLRGALADPVDGRPHRGRKPRGRGQPLHHLPAGQRAASFLPRRTGKRMNAEPRIEGATGTRAKLLIVEDDEGLQRQLRWAYDDYEVLVASDRSRPRSICCARRSRRW